MKEPLLTRRQAVALGALAAAAGLPGLALAADDAPIKLEVTFPPGGSTDIAARIMQPRLGEVAEGVNTLKVLKAKAQELNVYMPLVAGLHAILFEGRTLNQVIEVLMRAEPKTDVDFISTSGFN